MLKKKNLRSAVKDYILAATYAGHSPKTLKNKRQFCSELLATAGDGDYSLEVAQQFLQSMRDRDLAPSSVRNAVRLLRAFTHYLVTEGELEVDFSKKLVMPKVSKKN